MAFTGIDGIAIRREQENQSPVPFFYAYKKDWKR